MPSTADLVATLDALIGEGSEEVVAAEDATRLGLALDPPASEDAEPFDAVLLHRSYGFDLPPGVGVVACHDPLDRALGLARNRFLHADLGLEQPEELAPKLTAFDAPPDVADRVVAAFGGREGHHRGPTPSRVAFADAMNADLVERAAAAGAELYVTGSWRVPGAEAVERTGIGVLVVGHARQERWSLQRLAALLREHGHETADIRMR